MIRPASRPFFSKDRRSIGARRAPARANDRKQARGECRPDVTPFQSVVKVARQLPRPAHAPSVSPSFLAGVWPLRATFRNLQRSLLRGAWRSLVARSVRDRKVGGSNPLAPTNISSNRSHGGTARRHALPAPSRRCLAPLRPPKPPLGAPAKPRHRATFSDGIRSWA